MVSTQAKTGKAVCAFRCTDGRPRQAVLDRFKEAFENMLAAHEETKIPTDLRLRVLGFDEGISHLRAAKEGSQLFSMLETSKGKGANLIAQAELPERSNQDAASELGYVFNCYYGATELFDKENEGRFSLVMDVYFKHEESGIYVSLLREQSGN
ncbi:MAG: hypothetical protein V1827_00510 [Candidatus Micrarchaeota archaeon]